MEFDLLGGSLMCLYAMFVRRIVDTVPTLLFTGSVFSTNN